MTAQILRRLVPLSFDRRSRGGRLRWAALRVGHNLLLRGGELGQVDNRGFDAAAVITLSYVALRANTEGCEVVVVEVMPIKDARVTRSRGPLVIRRRCLGSFAGGGRGATHFVIQIAYICYKYMSVCFMYSFKKFGIFRYILREYTRIYILSIFSVFRVYS